MCLPADNTIDAGHALQQLRGHSYQAAALNCTFTDSVIGSLPDNYPQLRQMAESNKVRLMSRVTLTIEQSATLHQLNQNPNNSF